MLDNQKYLRQLPAVDKVINSFQDVPLHRKLLVEEIQQVLEELRQQILEAEAEAEIPADITPEYVSSIAMKRLRLLINPSLKKVINATGTVVHTNLGRAPLSDAARDAVAAAAGYCNLEMDMDSGRRGSRQELVEDLICRLTGAEAAMVVNNNAAAVLLVLSALSDGREVIVSRGQLVEIGGSFRVPEVMRLSGAQLVEVGTTNRTHPWDYEQAINERTALLLRVHPSNYKITGFTAEVGIEELAAIGHRHGLPVVEDAGSGVLINPAFAGLPAEITVKKVIAAGADVVTFSGDKLLGGAQAGVIAGRREYVSLMRCHQLARPLRIDKLCLAALEATLQQYLLRQELDIPTWRLLSRTKEQIKARVSDFRDKLNKMLPPGVVEMHITDGESAVGGGAMPDLPLPTALLSIISPMGEELLSQRLRQQKPPIVTRRGQGVLLLDFRTVEPDEEKILMQAMYRLLTGEVR